MTIPTITAAADLLLEEITGEWPEGSTAYLVALGDTGSHKDAAAASGWSTLKAFRLASTSASFDEAMRCAEAMAARVELLERAIQGTPTPLYFQGLLTGHTIVTKSDTLLALVVKRRVPGFEDQPTVKQTTINDNSTHSTVLFGNEPAHKVIDITPVGEALAALDPVLLTPPRKVEVES